MANDRENGGAINLDDFRGSESKPALKPDALGGKKHAVLTVSDYRTVRIPNGDGSSRNAFILEFREFPDLAYWINRSGLAAICDRYGNKPDSWLGKAVPLTVTETTVPRTGEVVDALHVIRPMDWDEALGVVRPGRKPRGTGAKRAAKKGGAAKKAAAKRGGKKK
jgi:hypothetical protein